MNRREMVAGLAAMTGLGVRQQATGNRQQAPAVLPSSNLTVLPAGRLKQSVSYWPYNKIALAEFA